MSTKPGHIYWKHWKDATEDSPNIDEQLSNHAKLVFPLFKLCKIETPSGVNNDNEYVKHLCFDPAHRKITNSSKYEALIGLLAITFGHIAGPIIRGDEKFEFVGYGPIFKDLPSARSSLKNVNLESLQSKNLQNRESNRETPLKFDVKCVPAKRLLEGVTNTLNKHFKKYPETYVLLLADELHEIAEQAQVDIDQYMKMWKFVVPVYDPLFADNLFIADGKIDNRRYSL
jgi:hypothetical protein